MEPRREMLTNDDWDTLELTTSSRGLTYRHETPSAGSEVVTGSEAVTETGKLDARRLKTLTGAPTITGRLSMGRPVFQPATMLQRVNFATEPDRAVPPATGVNAERRATARAIWQTQTAEG